MPDRHDYALLGALLCAVLPVPGHSETHALIMTISEYTATGASRLPGVAHDAENARQIARRLGVKDSNMTFLADRQLDYAGTRAAFDALHDRIGENDQVFIYFSGHGGRRRMADPVERCAESLITVNGNEFVDAELEVKLKILSRKAEKLIVFIDACHSGGVTTRGAKSETGDPDFVAKYYSKTARDACQTPVNVLRRNLTLARSAGSGAGNHVYIASSRDDEVSLDERGKGGVATQAWLQCLNGAARDLDGSGAITAEEIRVCAQDLIDRKLGKHPRVSTQHISITGNGRVVLSLLQSLAGPQAVTQPAPATPSRPPAMPVTSAPATGAPSASAQTPVPAASETVSPTNTLRDIYSQRDDRRIVVLTLSQPAYKIGRDAVQFRLTSSHAGFVYLLMVGSDGKTFDMLFPNRLDGNNLIGADESVALPRPNWQITASGPAGKNQLLAIVADAPRDFSKLKLTAVGPFSMLEANPASARDIQLVTGSSASASSAECADPVARRNLAVAKRCSNAFGAAMLTVEETN